MLENISFQMNAVLLNIVFIKESWRNGSLLPKKTNKKSSTTIFKHW